MQNLSFLILVALIYSYFMFLSLISENTTTIWSSLVAWSTPYRASGWGTSEKQLRISVQPLQELTHVEISATTPFGIFCRYTYLPIRGNRLQNTRLILPVNFGLILDSLNEHILLLFKNTDPQSNHVPKMTKLCQPPFLYRTLV